jgi:DNA-binding winged helix-turn-helix (wHTH) protein
LLDAVWADIYIEETTLARNVSLLRQKLVEYDGNQSFIETVPKLGYRFNTGVTLPDENLLIIEEQTIQYVRFLYCFRVFQQF